MKLAIRFLLRLVLLLSVWVSLPAAAQPTNAIAVADFEMTGALPDSGDWAFGLADVLAIELQQRGVVLFERQQIRVVLGERQITASGLMQLRGNPVQGIPDLQYLVTGVISELTNREFHIEASLVEARTGRNAASFARDGHYPEDLPGALAALAEQIASRLKAAGVTAPEPVITANFTRKPEATLPFYKGVAYCMAGQPELGVTWLIDAQKADPFFLAPRVWTMRAFQMAGLPDFAAAARAKLQESPNGPGILNQLNGTRLLDQKLVSVAIISNRRLDAAGLQFQTKLKTVLGRDTNFFVADPSNIRSLAAEMDLQLAEKGGMIWNRRAFSGPLWTHWYLLSPTENSTAGLISVELHDAETGETLFRARTPRDGSQMANISRDLAEHTRPRIWIGELCSPLPGCTRQPMTC